MSKIRIPYSPEYALERAKDACGVELLAELCDKTPAMIYKWADPDEEAQIPVRAAIIIDHACMTRHGFAPFADVLDSLKKAAGGAGNAHGLNEAALYGQAALGQLATLIAQATAAAGDGGGRVTPREAQALILALDAMEQAIDDARRSVATASKARG